MGNLITTKQNAVQQFKAIVDGNYTQQQLKQVLGKNSGTFTTSLMEVYTNDTQLQQCDPKKVVMEAIKAATLKLPLNKQLGYAYIVVFKNWDKRSGTAVATPTIVVGYRGYIQLAMRTSQYKTINADVVYEGELKSVDKLTGRIDLSGEKTSERVEGFFAHFETVNGFTKTLYMSLQDMAAYALKYAPSLRGSKDLTVDVLCDTAQRQAVNGPDGGVGWRGDFIAMAQKTVLRRLLSKYGYLSIEMMDALTQDEPMSSDETRDIAVSEEKPEFVVPEEVKDEEEEVQPAAPI